MMPTLTTSREKMAAAMGVPNRAEKAALMLHMVMMFLSFSSKPTRLPMALPMLPPSCSAAPSRPAEPPSRWVIRVERKISGAMRRGSRWPEWMEESTRFVPVSFSCWSRR